MDWLNDPKIALYSIIMTELWRSSGFAMVVYLAGLKTIPRDLLDQASVDGARYLKKFRRVTFPLLAPSFTVTVLLMLINSLKVFETVLVLTNGGPGWVTEVFNTFIYRNFASGNWGYATSASLTLSLVIAAVAVLSFVCCVDARWRCEGAGNCLRRVVSSSSWCCSYWSWRSPST